MMASHGLPVVLIMCVAAIGQCKFSSYFVDWLKCSPPRIPNAPSAGCDPWHTEEGVEVLCVVVVCSFDVSRVDRQ